MPTQPVPTRTEFLHLSQGEQALFYVLAALAVALCAAQVVRRFLRWRRGRTSGEPVVGWQGVLRNVLLQRKVRSARKHSGAPMHVLTFYGFCALFLATTLLAINTYSPVKFHRGTYYLIYEAAFDTLGLLFVVGVSWALARRLWFRPKSATHSAADTWALALLLVLGLTGYLVEAARIANGATLRGAPTSFDAYSPVGFALARVLGAVSNDDYRVVWWVHSVAALGFIAALPRLRVRHLIYALFSSWNAPARPIGALRSVSIEEVEATGKVGAARAEDLARWQLMSLDACMECGRCTDVCPAHGVGKVLNPQKIVRDARAASGAEVALAEALGEEALWACTTCNACVDACPVSIRHVDLIVDARRHIVSEGRLSGTGALALRQIAGSQNAWGAQPDAREDWMQGLDVPLCRDGAPFEVLLWVGCAGATDPGAIRTTRAVAELLAKAGVRFACLGREESCTGDPARRIGEEFLFQDCAQRNADTLRRYGVRDVVTPCPHCFNTLKNEYGEFGARLNVRHHTELLADLVASGRLRAARAGPGGVVVHDPCYLARVNDVVEAPRSLVGGRGTLLPQRNGKSTLCCGAGGGRMFMDESPDQRPGDRRARELIETGAKTVAVSCPFCRIMLDASIQQVAKSEIRLVDVAEALREANA